MKFGTTVFWMLALGTCIGLFLVWSMPVPTEDSSLPALSLHEAKRYAAFQQGLIFVTERFACQLPFPVFPHDRTHAYRYTALYNRRAWKEAPRTCEAMAALYADVQTREREENP